MEIDINTINIETLGIIVAVISIIVIALITILKTPFYYPYFTHEFDVSGKRNPQIDDWLDTFLISGGFDDIQSHQAKINVWKEQSLRLIDKEFKLLKEYRRKQYKQALNDDKAFRFTFTRLQTRYKQQNYVKQAYKVKVQIDYFDYEYKYIQHRYNDLADINFECTLREYNSKNQRKLATRELREKIMQRDNYTCQICGKYMPDEVGLQVDHIIPIAKGGKTVVSNLRVLCSKCNGAKHDKMPYEFENNAYNT